MGVQIAPEWVFRLGQNMQLLEQVFFKSVVADDNPIVAQVVKGEAVFTIATKFSNAVVPGPSWHQRGEIVVETLANVSAEIIELDISWRMQKTKTSVFDIEICSELNGSLNSLRL